VPEDTLKFPELDDKKPQPSDPHLLILDTGVHRLYELYNPKMLTGIWRHHGAATFDLTKNLPSRSDGYSNFGDTNFSPVAKIIIRCLKTYGLIVADTGPPFKISGTNDLIPDLTAASPAL
jgi:hypothetical protein